MNTINVENCKTLLIGRRGENEVTTVAFDFTEWQTEFGSGVVDLYVKRFGDESAYPVVLTIDGTVASWLVTETDTNVAGYGKAEYVYRVDGKIAKSAVFPFFVAEDIGQPASEPPDPYESWLEQLTALGAETEAHAQAAEQSAENAAESAEDAAQSAASAEGYAGQAETAAGLAQAAQTASESARDAAQTAQTSAEASATAAIGSAASAAGSASDASASATAAGASATAASASATTASNAATAAQAAQSAAEDAAEDAQEAAQQAHVEYEQLSDAVDDLTEDVAQQKSAFEDLQALTNRKAGILVDTASGAIASFVPDATIPNLLGVTVDVEPVQDLHGYDNPWPAGGGKNKFNVNAVETVTDNFGGKITQNQNGTITIQTTASANVRSGHTLSQLANVSVGERYTLTLTTTGSQNLIYLAGTGVTWYDGASKTITQEMMNADICFYASGPNTSATVSNIMICLESVTDATYAPYKNICPISGWDAVEVEADGVNIYPPTQKIENAYISTSGEVVLQNLYTVYYCAIKKGVTYTYSMDTGTPIYAFYSVLPEYGAVSYNGTRYVGTAGAVNVTFTAPIDGYIAFRIASTFTTPTVVVGSTAPANYVPYSGNRYTIQLGQTVYGGTLDATNGTLTVDRVELVVTDCTGVSTASTGIPYASKGFTVRAKAESSNNKNISSEYRYRVNAPSDSGWFRVVTTNVFIFDSRFTDQATANSILSSEKPQFVYELETPITIQLDPATIATIAGQTNNVWADAGDVDVTFAADVKTYIDQKIAAAVAALS